MLSHRACTPSSQGLVCEARAVRVWMQRGADRLLTQPHHPRQAKSAILYPSDLGVLCKGDLTLQKQWAETKSRLTSEDPAQRPNTRASKKKATFPEPTVKSKLPCQIKFLHTWCDLRLVQFLYQYQPCGTEALERQMQFAIAAVAAPVIQQPCTTLNPFRAISTPSSKTTSQNMHEVFLQKPAVNLKRKSLETRIFLMLYVEFFLSIQFSQKKTKK